MRELKYSQRKVLDAIISLWDERSDEIKQNDVVVKTGICSQRVSAIVKELESKGFVEQIRYDKKNVELKPLKFSDGEPYVSNPKAKLVFMRVPRGAELYQALAGITSDDGRKRLLQVHA